VNREKPNITIKHFLKKKKKKKPKVLDRQKDIKNPIYSLFNPKKTLRRHLVAFEEKILIYLLGEFLFTK